MLVSQSWHLNNEAVINFTLTSFFQCNIWRSSDNRETKCDRIWLMGKEKKTTSSCPFYSQYIERVYQFIREFNITQPLLDISVKRYLVDFEEETTVCSDRFDCNFKSFFVFMCLRCYEYFIIVFFRKVAIPLFDSTNLSSKCHLKIFLSL